MRRLIGQVAETDANVLILGESGTGRGGGSRHPRAVRPKRGPFVPINCGAIPAGAARERAVRSREGAFTGAIAARRGRFELAQGAPSSSTKSATCRCRCRSNCCGCCRSASSTGSGRQGRPGGCAGDRGDPPGSGSHDPHPGISRRSHYRLNVFPIETPRCGIGPTTSRCCCRSCSTAMPNCTRGSSV